jgi:4-amino-4-deoxy-L-arabinose transferase-like glycosyltransferase
VRRSDYFWLSLVALAPRLVVAWSLPLASGSTDPNCAPDELAHFLAAREISLCRFEPWSPGAFSIYSSFLPSQYAFQAVALALGRALGGDIARFASPHALVAGFGYARLGSVLLGASTVLALTQSAWRLTRSRPQSLLAGLTVALFPQLVFVNAYVNADSFTIAAGALLTWTLVRWVFESQQRLNSILLGAALGLVFLGKLSGYYLLPPTAVVVWLKHRHQPQTPLGSIVAACLAIAGPLIIWNAARSGGDPFGLSAYQEFLANHWTRNPAPGPEPWRLFFSRLGMSTLGTFRNMDLFLPMPLYWGALALTVVGLLFAVSLWKQADRTARSLTWWFLSGSFLNIAVVWWNSWTIDFQPQGRYVLLAATSLATIAVVAPMRALPSAARIWATAVILFLLVTTGYALHLIAGAPCVP